MSLSSSDNKRIAKNTVMLYIRMFFTMAVSLFTSRVILQTLGVTDYGINNVVGGVVSMFSFLNGAMASATQRYLNVDIATGNEEHLKTTFRTAMQIHLSLKLGAGPTSVAWILLIAYAILGLIIKPILIIKIVNYSWKDIMSVYIPCLYVTLISVPLPCFLYLNQEQWFPNTIVRFCVITFVSVLCVGLSAWFLGIDKEMREKVIKMVKGRLHRG